MVDASSIAAIAALDRAAADLDRLLCGWTKSRVAETESDPSALSKPESLETINAGIQSLWRLVSIHKSIEQLKNPPAATPTSESASKPGTPISRSANSPQAPKTPQPSHPLNPPQPAPPAAPPAPYVPCVPLVPSLGSLDAIIAQTDRVYAEVTALCEASGIPVPDPTPDAHAAVDQLGLNFLDALSRRAKYPGSGRLIDSIRADLATSPP